MHYTHLGEMFERLPIFAAALILGLASGCVAVRRLTDDRPGRFSLRSLMGGVVLAALLAALIAAKPEAGASTLEFWALAAWGMAIVDLAVFCLLDSRVTPGRFSPRTRRRIGVGLLLATALMVAAIALRFDLGRVIARHPLDFIGNVLAIILPAALLDLMARLGAGRMRRWRRRGS